jgi:hypothetical protein
MSSHKHKRSHAGYEVGRGRPPIHTRFKKGRSGNPGGRPRGVTAGRARSLILKEAYRQVRLREGDNVIVLPAFQAIVRALIAGAAKGNGPAQRAFIAQVQAIEQEIATQTAARGNSQSETLQISDLELARRIAFILEKGKRELEQDH